MTTDYDYIITKPPLNEDTLAHYGVKGMKWRKHKTVTGPLTGDTAYKIISGWSDKEYQARLARVKLGGGRSSGSKSSGSSKSSGGSSSKATDEKKTSTKEKVAKKEKETIEYPKTKIDPEVTKRLQERLDKINASSKLKTIEENASNAEKKKKNRK